MSAINNVYEGLVEYAPGSTKIVGLLAKSWEISDDGLTYTFHLVDGVKFHDGTPFNAAAVVNSFEAPPRSRSSSLSYFLANVKDMEAPDDCNGRAHAQPSSAIAPRWPRQSVGPEGHQPEALAEHDNGDFATTWLNEHAVGTGPFKLTEFKRGERYVLERNDDYWGAKPYFSEIQISVVPDIRQQILQLQAGEIDAVPINYPFAQLGSLPAGLEITSSPSMNQYDLFLKPKARRSTIPEIRKAVLTAINPALWVKDAFGRFATLSKSVYPNVVLDPVHPITFPTDFEAAKAAIAAHGEVDVRRSACKRETPELRPHRRPDDRATGSDRRQGNGLRPARRAMPSRCEAIPTLPICCSPSRDRMPPIPRTRRRSSSRRTRRSISSAGASRSRCHRRPGRHS